MKKNQFTTDDLSREMTLLIANIGKAKTKPELHDWLVRVYSAAAKVAMIQRGYSRKSFNGQEKEQVGVVLAQFPDYLEILNGLAQQAVIDLRNL